MSVYGRRVSLRDRIRRVDLRHWSGGPLAYSVSSLLHYGVRSLVGKRVQRDTEHIQAEYANDQRNDYWKEEPSLEELIYGDHQTPRWIVDDGDLRVGTSRRPREVLIDRLRARVEELGAEQIEIAEFGCGTGRNLFFLKKEFPHARCVGLELTPSTVDVARRNAKRFGLDVEFQVADMTREVPLESGSVDLAYSVHALEQLHTEFPSAVAQMVRVARSRLVFFEPVRELFPMTVAGLAGRMRVRNANYLNGLFEHLQTHPSGSVSYAAAMKTVAEPLNHTVEIRFDLR